MNGHMKESKQSWVANLLILLALFSRLIPHPANFTPVGATALVGGAKLGRMWRWTVPFIALTLSDMLLNLFYGTTAFSAITPFVYGAFALNIFLGRFVRGNRRYLKLVGLSLFASLQFFAISNLGVWLTTSLYAKTVSGLTQCYVMALPFFSNTLLSDLIWGMALFGIIDRSQAWISRKTLFQEV